MAGKRSRSLFTDSSNMRTAQEVSIYRLIGRGTIPKPVQIGLKAASWPRADIDAWMRAGPPSPLRRRRCRIAP